MAELLNLNTIAFKKAEYKRQNLWILSMDGIDAYTAQSSEKPHWVDDAEMKVNFISIYSKYQAGRGNWNDISMTLNDPINASASQNLYKLLLNQWNFETGRAGAKSQYAKIISLKLLQPAIGIPSADSTNANLGGTDGSIDTTSVAETWELHNAWFKDINWNANPLDYDATNRLQCSFILTYDFPKFISGS